MNFFQARVSDDGAQVELPGGDCLHLPPNGTREYHSQEVILGIRPEHFRVDEENSGAMHLRVSHVETLGADTLVYGYLGHTDSFLTVRLADIHHFKKDAVLPLLAPPEKLHLFDRHSEKRIVT